MREYECGLLKWEILVLQQVAQAQQARREHHAVRERGLLAGDHQVQGPQQAAV